MFGLMLPRRERELMRSPNEWLRREFGSLFERMFPEWPMVFEAPVERTWGIETEVKPTEFVVRAELPGFEVGEIEVLHEGNLLTIRAEHRVPEVKEPVETPAAEAPATERPAVERPYARVERTFTLPEGVIPEKIEARYHNGVLEVHLPRAAEARPRRIPVT